MVQVLKDGERYNAIEIKNKKHFKVLQKKHKKGNYPIKVIHFATGVQDFLNINKLSLAE
jgi:hypothetical protein